MKNRISTRSQTGVATGPNSLRVNDPPAMIHPPQQERAGRPSSACQGGESLLEEEGYDGFTLAEVSKRANVSIGSIYARVRSKDDLFYVIQDRYMTVSETVRGSRPRCVERPRRPPLSSGSSRRSASCSAERAGASCVHAPGSRRHVVATRSSASVSQFQDEVVANLLTKRDAIAHQDPELAIDVAFRMAWGTLARQIMYWPMFESKRSSPETRSSRARTRMPRTCSGRAGPGYVDCRSDGLVLDGGRGSV